VPVQAAELRGIRVLLVDDEPFLLECLADALQSWGCQVTACTQAAEAIVKLQAESYDCIVSDIRMPGLSGIQFHQWVQTHQARMAGRMLFTTGDSFDPETQAFLESVSAPHLGKPFDLQKLRQSLVSLLAAVAAT